MSNNNLYGIFFTQDKKHKLCISARYLNCPSVIAVLNDLHEFNITDQLARSKTIRIIDPVSGDKIKYEINNDLLTIESLPVETVVCTRDNLNHGVTSCTLRGHK